MFNVNNGKLCIHLQKNKKKVNEKYMYIFVQSDVVIVFAAAVALLLLLYRE